MEKLAVHALGLTPRKQGTEIEVVMERWEKQMKEAREELRRSVEGLRREMDEVVADLKKSFIRRMIDIEKEAKGGLQKDNEEVHVDDESSYCIL